MTDSALECFDVQSIRIGCYKFFAIEQMGSGVTRARINLNHSLAEIGTEAIEKPSPESRSSSHTLASGERRFIGGLGI
jgi:hypothetical protein